MMERHSRICSVNVLFFLLCTCVSLFVCLIVEMKPQCLYLLSEHSWGAQKCIKLARVNYKKIRKTAKKGKMKDHNETRKCKMENENENENKDK